MIGVAVGPGKGAPLMRFFKANQGPRTAEDEAAFVRLMAIADRCKIRDTDPVPSPSAQTLDETPAPGRQ